jgi:hypothetical protein
LETAPPAGGLHSGVPRSLQDRLEHAEGCVCAEKKVIGLVDSENSEKSVKIPAEENMPSGFNSPRL